MKVVDLPENYVAFVLAKKHTKKPPSSACLEKLCHETRAYVLPKLQSKLGSGVSSLNLKFKKVEMNSGKPKPQYHLYITVKAQVQFDDNAYIPEVADVFEPYISSFTKAYLNHVVVDKKILEHAIEVRARKIGKGTPGGAVTAPRFFVALVCEHPRDLNAKEQSTFLAETRTVVSKKLLEEMDDFACVKRLDMVKTELHAGKPDPEFNVYVELELVAKFHQNVPEPMEVFRALSTMQAKQLQGALPYDMNMSKMTVRCVLVDTPDLPPPVDKPEEEEEQEGGDPAAGDPEDQPKDDKKADPNRPTVKIECGFYVALVLPPLDSVPPLKQRKQMDQLLHQFYTRAFHNDYPGAFNRIELTGEDCQVNTDTPLPRFNLLHPYQAIVHFEVGRAPADPNDALRKILYCNLPQLYNVILKDGYPTMKEFTLGRALEKQCTDQAYGGSRAAEVAAAEAAAKKKAEEEQRKREEAAKRKAEEEERKRKEEAARAKALAEKKRKEQEAAAAAAEKKRKEEEEALKKKQEEEKRRKLAEAKAAAEKKRKEEEAAAAAAAAEKKRKEEEAAAKRKQQEAVLKRKQAEAAKAAAEKKRKEEEKARLDAEKRAKKEKEAAAKARREAERKKKEDAIRAAARPQPVVDDGPTVPVGTADVYVAFTCPNCKSEPTQDQYKALASKTEDFYSQHLKKKFPSMRRVEVTVSKACYGQDKPDNRYNVYIEWDIKADFQEGGNNPDRFQLCTSLVNIDLNSYVLQHVRSVKNSPFERVSAVYTQQVNTF